MHTYELHDCIMLHGQFKTILLWNQNLTPVTPNDPRLTIDPTIYVEGLKLM